MYSILYQPNSKGKFYVGPLVKYGSIIANVFFFMNFGVSSFIYLINIKLFFNQPELDSVCSDRIRLNVHFSLLTSKELF